MKSSIVTEHQKLVKRLIKPGCKILAELESNDCHLIHMAMGITGEAGELLDAIKKHTIYKKPLDIVNVIEELGDIEFFLEGIRAALGITRSTTLTDNMFKLNKRYPRAKYSNAAAQARQDKAQ